MLYNLSEYSNVLHYNIIESKYLLYGYAILFSQTSQQSTIIYIISCRWCLKPPKGQTLIMISFFNNKGHVSIIHIPLILAKVRWRESNIAATVGPEAIETNRLLGECPPFPNRPWQRGFFRLGVQTFQCKSHFIFFHPPIVAVWFCGNWPNQPGKDCSP